MSNKNDEGSGASIGILFVIALIGYAFLIAIIIAVICFILFVIGLSLRAWINGGVWFQGEYISEEAGRAFIVRGLISCFLAPLFFVVGRHLTGGSTSLEHWHIIMACGFVCGSFGGEALDAFFDPGEAPPPVRAVQEVLPPLENHNDNPTRSARPAPPPFKFASWDDEEIIDEKDL